VKGIGGHEHTVLVVDDSNDTRESLGLLLEMHGCRVAPASGGPEALHLMLTLGMRPCVVLLDLIMPRMDGLTFQKEQRKHPAIAAIPLIAVTGHEGLRRHALDVGFAAAVLKPCDFDELLGLIEEHCAATAPGVRVKRA